MSHLFIKDAAGSTVAYLETVGGSPADSLTVADVQVDLKKAGEAFFTNKELTAPVNATAEIGAGADGTVTVSVPGSAGNSYTVEVTVPSGTHPLTVTKSGTELTVALSVSSSTPVDPDNTATLIAAAINALGSEIVATASGTGADSLDSPEGPTDLDGGVDGDFTALGGGSYELVLSVDDTDTLGSLYIRLSGPNLRTVILSGTVAEAVSASPTPELTVPTSAIFGYIRDAAGSPVANVAVSVRVLSTPTILHPTTDGLVLTNSLITTRTDSAGFFTMNLVSGSQVDVFISSAGYRRTITVPSSSTNLFDIP